MARKYSTGQDNYIDFNGSKPVTAQTKVQPCKCTDLDFLFQEIEVLLTTSPYDVFNSVDEFIDLRSYVFKAHISALNTTVKDNDHNQSFSLYTK